MYEKRISTFFYFFYFLLCTCFSYTTEADRYSSTPAKRLKERITAEKNQTTLSMKVVSLKNGQTIFQENSGTALIPASITKLFTAGAALHILGPQFRYETAIGTNAFLTPSSIDNLYIKGSGDPSLKTADLKKLANVLRKKGIKEIKGSLIIDSSIFDDQPSAFGWESNDGPIFAKSEVSGLLVNHSCVTVTAKPAHAPGRKPLITINPATPFIRIDNKALTSTRAAAKGFHTLLTRNNTILVSGKIAQKSKPKFYHIAIHNPDIVAGHVMRSTLKQEGIVHRGSVRRGTTPPSFKILGRHTSKPAQELIKTMMKKSDNLYADALLKTVGARVYGIPGTWEKGNKARSLFLTKTMNLSKHRFSLYDGSGLSRANRVSADLIVDFLTAFYKKSPYKKEFIDSLPIAGIDGTLCARMGIKGTKGIIKAKTGSLRGVSSLAGYSMAPSGNYTAFSILMNDNKERAFHARKKLEDSLCTILASL